MWHKRYAGPVGRICSRLAASHSFIKGFNLHACPAGAYFCSCKRNQNTLGALPQDPCRWLCWIRIDLRREPEINPYCAQNRSQGSRRRICPFPPPPFPRRERGSDGLAIKNRQQHSRGVRVCKTRKPPTLKYLLSFPIVPCRAPTPGHTHRHGV